MEFDDRVTVDLLRPAADGLRRALKRMDEDDVPAPLRPLADSSARRLPPPLVKRALSELDGSEWLRDELLAEVELEEGSASQLFVARPEGWERRLEDLAGRADEQRQESQRSALERQLAEALARIERLEQELKADTDRVASAERKVRDRLRGEIEAAEHARREAESRARDEARQAARATSRNERLLAELEAAETRIESLRQLLEKERRAAAVGEGAAPARGWFPSEPMAMGEELDRILTAVRRPASAEPDPSPPLAEVRLPEGTRPDLPEAIRWLASHPFTWLIDGYNVAFHIHSEPDVTTRTRLVAEAGRLAGLAAPGSMVVIVFDSSVDSSSLPADRRARVVYAPSADEWIIEHAGAGTVVVSSDRRVREAGEAAGAVGVWSEALAGWIAGGGRGLPV
ncbi:MAG TPA: hypothetical protein VLB85_12315 [Acidimicrobiia bacterium]|nr:hypothetical protein [Acidimicrobiia bacterium]